MLQAQTTQTLNITANSGVSDFDLDPVAQGSAERHYVSLVFKNASGDVVAKNGMTGNVTVFLSEDKNDYGTMFDGTVALGADTYKRPHAAGSYGFARVDFSGVTTPNGATQCEVTVYSHG